MLLHDKIALVTGASSGIGSATAIRFAQEGAKVALLGRNQEALRETQNEIKKAGGSAHIITADVSRPEACERAVADTIDKFQALDILVNAAGIIGAGDITSTSLEDWRTMMQINLDGVFMMMQHAVPHLERTKGCIVNVSSVTGVRAFPNVLAYCVSKAGVDQLTRCTALELAPKGVRVNAVNPGVVVTQLHRRGGFDEDAYQAFLERSKSSHPLGRVGQPEEIAESILYLASGQSGWITGVTLSIDGGRHLTCAR